MSTTAVVLGGLVDGSGWRGVNDELRADGIDVRVVQSPMTDDLTLPETIVIGRR